MARNLFHGSPRKVRTLQPREEHGDPRVKPVVFASPSETFALAYTGRKWGDRDLEQSTRGGKTPRMTLREMRPGAFQDIYGKKKGYLYEVPPETFKALPGRRTAKEVASSQSVRPLGIKVVPDALKALQQSLGVELHPYDPSAPETRAAIRRQVKRMREMDDGGEGYLKWRLKPAPGEVKQIFREEMKKRAGAGLPPVEAYVTGPSGAGKTTFTKKTYPAGKFHILRSDAYKKVTKTPEGVKRTFAWGRAIRDAKASGKPVVVDSLNIHEPLARAAKDKILLQVSQGKSISRRKTRGFSEFDSDPKEGRLAYEHFTKNMKPVADRLGFIEKRAEPPPPKGVSSKEWDKILQPGPAKSGKEKTSLGDWTEIGPVGNRSPKVRFKTSGFEPEEYSPDEQGPQESRRDTKKYADYGPEQGDPMKLMPHIKRIHKIGHVKTAAGVLRLRDLRRMARMPSQEQLMSWQSPVGPGPMDPSSQYHMARLERMSSSEESEEEKAPLELLALGGRGMMEGAQYSRMAERGIEGIRDRLREKLGSVTKKAGLPSDVGSGSAAVASTSSTHKLRGHTSVQGIPIAIENRAGDVRTGVDRGGHKWKTRMSFPYGYIKGTKGKDGEEVDAYVGPDKEAPKAFVVHQHKPDGTGYDEDKIMLGFKNKKEAKEAFNKHYDSDKFLGPISVVSMERLRQLVASKKRLVKISHVTYRGFLDELHQQGMAQGVIKEAQAPAQPAQRPKKPSLFKRIRKAGPAVGGLIGAGVGAVLGRKKGKLLRGALAGLGTGATLGWTPDMAASATEAVRGR